MHYILHIGQSKTGTSSLQTFLAENRSALIDQGFCYPDVYQLGMPLHMIEHNSAVDSISGARRYPRLEPEEYFAQFRAQAEASNCDKIILSAESFWGGAPQMWDLCPEDDYLAIYRDKLERLTYLMGDATCEVIMYLRRPDMWLQSVIGHSIRYEKIYSNAKYESDQQMADMFMPRLDYHALLGLWSEVMKPTAMKIRLYQGNTVEGFLEQIELSLKKLRAVLPAKEENTSLSRELVEFKKQLNQRNISKTEERLTHAILEELNQEIGSGQKYCIDTQLKAELLERLGGSLKNLANDYGLVFEEFNANDEPSFTSSYCNDLEMHEIEKLFVRKRRSVRFNILWLKLSLAHFMRNHAPKILVIAKNLRARLRRL